MKKIGVVLFACLIAFLLTSCDEILSVVTVNENGEKVVSNYVAMFGDKVYDENSALKSWQDLDIVADEEIVKKDDLLFKIESKKENIVVLGDKDSAIEISFFDGGYEFTLFASADSLNQMKSFGSMFDF